MEGGGGAAGAAGTAQLQGASRCMCPWLLLQCCQVYRVRELLPAEKYPVLAANVMNYTCL